MPNKILKLWKNFGKLLLLLTSYWLIVSFIKIKLNQDKPSNKLIREYTSIIKFVLNLQIYTNSKMNVNIILQSF